MNGAAWSIHIGGKPQVIFYIAGALVAGFVALKLFEQ
jgi:hypothetical protein